MKTRTIMLVLYAFFAVIAINFSSCGGGSSESVLDSDSTSTAGTDGDDGGDGGNDGGTCFCVCDDVLNGGIYEDDCGGCTGPIFEGCKSNCDELGNNPGLYQNCRTETR